MGGAQALSLGPGCIYVGIVMHEMMHAAGFWHEQSRQDRDNFITINTFNIQNGMEYNFQKYGWDRIQSLGVDYDLGKRSGEVLPPLPLMRNTKRRTFRSA